MIVYRFHCWEEQHRTYLPSLVANCTRSGRIGYFESDADLLPIITSMAGTNFEVDGSPLITLKVANHHTRHALYATFDDLLTQSHTDPMLRRMLVVLSTGLHPRHRLVA